MMILLFQKNKKKYDILIINEFQECNVESRMYNEKCAVFTLMNNEKRIYFYINKRINENN